MVIQNLPLLFAIRACLNYLRTGSAKFSKNSHALAFIFLIFVGFSR